MDLFYTRVYALLLGRRFGASPVGYFRNADVISQMPLGFLAALVGRVAFPMLSAASDDPGLMRRGLQVGLRGMMLVNAPVMLLTAALAPHIVLVLLGPGWSAVSPILALLCLAGLLHPAHVLNLNVLMARGQSRLMFRVEVAKKVIGLVLLALGLGLGVTGVAAGYFAASIVAFVINAHFSGRILGFGVIAQARELAPPILVAMPGALLAWLISQNWAANPAIVVVCLALLGFLTHVALCILFRLSAWRELIALLPKASAGGRGGRTV
jgi:O-antigen/teichoic acid export membrane protein